MRNLLFTPRHHYPRVPHVSLLLRDVGFHGSIPLRILAAPRPGRVRLQSCRKLPSNGAEPRRDCMAEAMPYATVNSRFLGRAKDALGRNDNT